MFTVRTTIGLLRLGLRFGLPHPRRAAFQSRRPAIWIGPSALDWTDASAAGAEVPGPAAQLPEAQGDLSLSNGKIRQVTKQLETIQRRLKNPDIL